MSELTKSLESSTRKKIDIILNNLGWDTDEDSIFCNVFTERVKTRAQQKKLKGNKPDYSLYKSGTGEIIGVIETKKKGKKLDIIKKEAIEKYCDPLDVPILFITDGTFFIVWDVEKRKEITLDGGTVSELLSEKELLRFIYEGSDLSSETETIKYSRDQLMDVFKWANIILRKEGIREGFDRFIEFANLLFLKLISEIEDERESRGEKRTLERKYCWGTFADFPAEPMLEYINEIVLPHLVDQYNHSGDVFSNKLQISNPETLKEIVDKLTKLKHLINTDSDVKGDAFEYFLKNSVTVGNDLGEYFTPRHIVKLMVDLVNPQFGDRIYDPTCGTGGFLIQAFNHIKRSCKATSSNLKILTEETVFGRELTNTARIAKMNMIITGDGHTNIIQLDSLEAPVENLYDIVLANPPYAQTTDYGDLYPVHSIQADPIFLQHIMLSLNDNGKAAVIVPEGVLYRRGADKKVRELLLTKYNLIAIISLPSESFVPYALAKTYILIFQKGSQTKKVWFFDVENDGFSLDNNRVPIKENDITRIRLLWDEKNDSENSWIATYDEIVSNNFILAPLVYKPPDAPTKGISKDEADIYLNELRNLLSDTERLVANLQIVEILTKCNKVPLNEIFEEVKRPVQIMPDEKYKLIGVRLYGNGIFIKDEKEGSKIKAKKMNKIKSGDFIYSKLFAWKGSFDLVGDEFDNCFASNEFPTFRIRKNNKWNGDSNFIKYYFKIPSSWKLAEQKSLGTTKKSRNRLKVEDFFRMEIPIPEPEDMNIITELLMTIEDVSSKLKKSENMADNLLKGVVATIFENMK